MAPKSQPKPKASPAKTLPTPGSRSLQFKQRLGLGAYLEDPAAFPASRVIYSNDSFVAIHDMFPKATVHTLLLPRSPQHNLLHPFDALADDDFREQVAAETAKLEELVARELQRRLGGGSRSDARREAVLEGTAEPDKPGQLPAGRDWASEVISGVHAVPSMSHLHVHVLSRDMHSDKMRHRKHYNSFTTPFLVPLKDFPLAEDDQRRQTGKAGYLDWSMRCWRCDADFHNKFTKLKAHLEEEFEEWRRE